MSCPYMKSVYRSLKKLPPNDKIFYPIWRKLIYPWMTVVPFFNLTFSTIPCVISRLHYGTISQTWESTSVTSLTLPKVILLLFQSTDFLCDHHSFYLIIQIQISLPLVTPPKISLGPLSPTTGFVPIIVVSSRSPCTILFIIILHFSHP